jgi:hypothetical protein
MAACEEDVVHGSIRALKRSNTSIPGSEHTYLLLSGLPLGSIAHTPLHSLATSLLFSLSERLDISHFKRPASETDEVSLPIRSGKIVHRDKAD